MPTGSMTVASSAHAQQRSSLLSQMAPMQRRPAPFRSALSSSSAAAESAAPSIGASLAARQQRLGCMRSAMWPQARRRHAVASSAAPAAAAAAAAAGAAATAEKAAADASGKPSTAYPFPEIEQKWQDYWLANKTFRTPDQVDTSKPKYYVLDMFPYPRCEGCQPGIRWDGRWVRGGWEFEGADQLSGAHLQAQVLGWTCSRTQDKKGHWVGGQERAGGWERSEGWVTRCRQGEECTKPEY